MPKPIYKKLPKYQMHRAMGALKIKEVVDLRKLLEGATNGDALVFEDESFKPVTVPGDWVARYHAEAGGYYVVDPAGRAHFASAEQFEREFKAVPE